MGMLKSVRLQNYKCFKDTGEIEIKPLTILCGVNSSGKSSILKSLLMMKQTAESNLSDPIMALSGDLVDCGTFNSVLNKNCSENCTFSIHTRFEINNYKVNSTKIFIKKQDAETYKVLERMYGFLKKEILRFIIEVDLEIERDVHSNNEFSSYLSNNRIKNYIIKIHAEDNDGPIEKSYGEFQFRHRKNVTQGKKKDDIFEPYCLSWSNIPYAYNWKGQSARQDSFNRDYLCDCTFNGLAITSIFAYSMSIDMKSVTLSGTG